MSKIKFVVFDFDGVFTDGKINIGKKSLVSYNVKDGQAISMLKKNGIKVGCISSFNFKFDNLCLKEQMEGSEITRPITSREVIFQHLGFDKYSIGIGNKLKILKKWVKELGMTMYDVAYMGDDLSDVDIIKCPEIVSACPSDACIECLKVSMYVSVKSGGNGCVRDFVEFLLHEQKLGQTISLLNKPIREIKYAFKIAEGIDLLSIWDLSETVKKCKGNVFFAGVGKSGNMAKHCCDLLKSLSIKSFFLDVLNSTHGNIGTMCNDDMIILFSNSGNTKELVDIIPFLKGKGVNVIGVCSGVDSKFKKLCDGIINLPHVDELSGNVCTVPTNSCMLQLIFSNILVSYLKDDMQVDAYAENHPNGSIGKDFLRIRDVVKCEGSYAKIVLDSVSGKSVPLVEVMMQMTQHKMGCCCFTDGEGEFLGIMTDGDIRRLLISKKTDKISLDDINRKPYCEYDIHKFISSCKKINYIPIVIGKRILGIVSTYNLDS